MTRMPVLFVGHGSPMNAIERNAYSERWEALGSELPRPEAILSVSAHWFVRGTRVNTSPAPRMIYDMYGFPDELYRIHYEPDGSAEYAEKALSLLGDMARADNDWGIDHGVWSVLSNMYPDADVPVVMISTDIDGGAEAAFEAGKRLAPLRGEGAMIFTSGNIVHNLRMVGWEMDNGYPWADRFDFEIKQAVQSGDFRTPVHYEKLTGADKAIPTVEHYYPFLTALGAASPEDQVTVWNEYRELGSMSMTSYLLETR